RSHAQPDGWSLSARDRECPVGGTGGFHTLVVSAHLYPAEARDATLHRDGRLPRCDAHPHRLGRRLRHYRPERLAALCYPLPLAVPALPRDCADVSRRLLACRVSYAARI